MYGSGKLTLTRVTIRNFASDAVQLMDEGVDMSVTESLFLEGSAEKAIYFNKIGKLVLKRSRSVELITEDLLVYNICSHISGRACNLMEES